jgi:hypothetical protein
VIDSTAPFSTAFEPVAKETTVIRRFAAVVAFTLAAACGGGLEQVDRPPLMQPTQSATPDAGKPAPTCGPAQLCSRTINECNQTFTQASCEAWYAKPSNCTDMAKYVECNCECVKEATCSDYFACGNICFNDYCK